MCICCYENGTWKTSIWFTNNGVLLIEKLKDNPIVYKEFVENMDSVIIKINEILREQL